MAPFTSRRRFIVTTGKAGIGFCAGVYGAPLLAESPDIDKAGSATYVTGFKQDPLPYAYNALNEAIDTATLEIHYTKYAAAYAANLHWWKVVNWKYVQDRYQPSI